MLGRGRIRQGEVGPGLGGIEYCMVGRVGGGR